MAQFSPNRAHAPATSASPPRHTSLPSPPSRPRPRPWRAPPSPRSEDDKSSSEGGAITGIVIGFVAMLLLVAVVHSLCKGRRQSRALALARARARAAAWAAIPAARQRPPQAEPRAREDAERRQLPTSRAARLPAFTYNQSLKHNVTGGGEEAATCSVCLGAFQHGESVRLLPSCLHLFHVECIDPWLDAHSTCPICRSDTDPTVDVAQIPPV